MKRERAVLLHDVRSAHNVGSIFRTADAAGVAKLWLTGYTPTPRDRFGRVQKEIAKTALGAQESVAWEYQRSPRSVIRTLRSSGWDIVAVEQDSASIDYRRLKQSRPTLFIFGNEVGGVPHALLRECDHILEIPMQGKKESLNVSVAAGVVLFQGVSTKARRPRGHARRAAE